MTEAEWLAEADPATVLAAAPAGPSERKLRLFASACCWSGALAFSSIRRALVIRDAVSVAVEDGGLADGAGEVDRQLAADDVPAANEAWPAFSAFARAAVAPVGRLRGNVEAAVGLTGFVGRRSRVSLLRDILGPLPFRSVSFSPEWRTSDAVAIAQQMYDSRDFSALPILADALQDAGCDNAEILNHCRDEKQVHVRGCWVVDLVLGKT